MNTSEDPNDRLIDSLLKEQAKGKPDEVLLRAIASKMLSAPKAKSERRNLDFFWPATAAAVVLLAAGGLLWKAFEKPEDETRRLVEAPGLDPEKAPELGMADGVLATTHPEPSDDGAAGDEGNPKGGEAEVAEAEKVRQDSDEGSGSGAGEVDPFGVGGGFVLPGDESEEDTDGSALAALRYVRDESAMWYVQFGMESGGKWLPKMVARAADGKMQLNNMSALNMLSPGDNFFKEGPMAGRFKFLGFTERQVTSERTKLTNNVKFAEYEDLKHNKKGERYESQYGLPDAQLTQSAYYDRTAVMEFEGTEFKVEERTKFSLPPGGEDGEFFLKQVTPERIVVEFAGADGKSVVRAIGKK
jgi:hypothetical protein